MKVVESRRATLYTAVNCATVTAVPARDQQMQTI
jgi:hypothetical protein